MTLRFTQKLDENNNISYAREWIPAHENTVFKTPAVDLITRFNSEGITLHPIKEQV